MTNEEAIKILDHYYNGYFGYRFDDVIVAHQKAIEALKDERPQGKWLIDGHHIRCNRCNEYICNTDREGNEIPDNFCPNCGADMREEADNEHSKKTERE